MNPYPRNLYRCTILRHIDADTTEVETSPGFDVRIRLTVRWASIDAPERGTPAGKVALAWVEAELPVGSTCLLATEKLGKEKYGRYLGRFYHALDFPESPPSPHMSVNAEMVAEGHARPYDGGKR